MYENIYENFGMLTIRLDVLLSVIPTRGD